MSDAKSAKYLMLYSQTENSIPQLKQIKLLSGQQSHNSIDGTLKKQAQKHFKVNQLEEKKLTSKGHFTETKLVSDEFLEIIRNIRNIRDLRNIRYIHSICKAFTLILINIRKIHDIRNIIYILDTRYSINICEYFYLLT